LIVPCLQHEKRLNKGSYRFIIELINFNIISIITKEADYVITSGQTEINNINQMTTIAGGFLLLIFSKWDITTSTSLMHCYKRLEYSVAVATLITFKKSSKNLLSSFILEKQERFTPLKMYEECLKLE